MKGFSRVALSLVLAASAGTAVAQTRAKQAPEDRQQQQTAPAKGPKLSKAVLPLLGEAQKMQQAGDYAGSVAKLDAASALPGLTAEDTYWINALRRNAAIQLKDNKMLVAAIQAQIATGLVPAEELPSLYRNLGALALQQNDYASATQYFEKLLALNPNDAEVIVGLAELNQRQKQSAKAVALLGQAIQVDSAGGQKAPENIYRRRLAIAYDAKLPDVQTYAMALVQAYPTAVNWRDALSILRDGPPKLDADTNFDALRLMQTVGALNGERDYFEYAETASNRGLPGEAKTALDEGVAKGMLSPQKQFVKDLSGVVNPKIAADKASLAGSIKDAKASPNGKLAMVTGDALYGYGRYAEAADLYRTALQKGGVDANIANINLGMALAKAKDKAGAKAAFEAVKSPGPQQILAQYWLIWLGQQA